MGPDGLPPKEDVARALLLRGSVFVHLDPRRTGVVLPRHLLKQPQVMLQIGLDMPIPIPDLRVDEEGICGTLSFNREPFTCVIPWSAVFALAGEEGRGMIWERAMPTELRNEVDREMGRRPPEGLRVLEGTRSDTIPPPPRSVMDELMADDEARDRAAFAEDDDELEEELPRRGHLRLVK